MNNQKNEKKIGGCITALVTPFKEDGSLDKASFEKLVKYQIKNGVQGLVICGTTGEAPTMTKDERLWAIHTAKDLSLKLSKGDVPIIAGTGSNNTLDTIEMSKASKEAGADACLIVTPPYNKPTQKGLIAHYSAIANTPELQNTPIIVYNVPGRTGGNVLPETCMELSKINNIIGIKEASGNLDQIAKDRQLCDDDFVILSGSDELNIPIAELGGTGAISVLSNVAPSYVREMFDCIQDGNIKKARLLQEKAQPLIKALFSESNPTPIKSLLKNVGLIESATPRLPLVDVEPKTEQLLMEEFKSFLDSIKDLNENTKQNPNNREIDF